jgi:hypothetical protein
MMNLSSRSVSIVLAASLGAGLTGAFIGRSIGEPAPSSSPVASAPAPTLAQELAHGAPSPAAEPELEGDLTEADEQADLEPQGAWDDYVVAKPAREPRQSSSTQPEQVQPASGRTVVARRPVSAARAASSTRTTGTTQSEAPERAEYVPDPPTRRRTAEADRGSVDREPSAPPRYNDNARRNESATLSRSDRDSSPSYSASNTRPTPRVYKKPSFWQRHRNLLTVAAGAGGGAILGSIIGGKKGAVIGGAAGAGGSALYTYRLRNRNSNRPHGQTPPPVRQPLFD